MSRDGHLVDGPLGRIELPGATLASIVVQAAERVDGARVRRPRRGLDVELEDGRVHVDVELAAATGSVLPDLGRAVQESVTEAVRTMTGLDVAAVDVSIEELDG
jgi:uncharacterized alkaline shock family protein YloU